MMTIFWRAGETVVLEMRSGRTWPGDFFIVISGCHFSQPVAVGEATACYSEMLDLNICLVFLNGWYYICLYRFLSFENGVTWSLGMAEHITVLLLYTALGAQK